MFLKKLILVNWGNIPQLEYEFGPVNLLSGGNGSGKTTLADAIQTLMTAAHDTLFSYNPGQDETTQRGRGGKQVRTLASYVMGCDDGSFARTAPTDCYIAGVFDVTRGEEGEPFTAVLGARARLDSTVKPAQARQDDLRFFLLPGVQLAIGDIIKEYSDGKHLLPLDKIHAVLQKQFGNIEQYDKKSAYLRRLYGALRGRKDAVPADEAKNAARTFAGFMAYKPVKSISEFVAREVLEKRDLGDAIRSVSELMKTIHGMEQEARQLVSTIDSLQGLGETAAIYREEWLSLAMLRYKAAKQAQVRLQQTWLAGKEKLRALSSELELNEQRRQQLSEDIERLTQRQIEVEAQRQGVPALRDKRQLELAITSAQGALRDAKRPLFEQEQQAAANKEALQELQSLINTTSIGIAIPGLQGKTFSSQLKAICNLELPDFSPLLGSDWVDLAPLAELQKAAESVEAAQNLICKSLSAEDSGQADEDGASLRDRVAAMSASLGAEVSAAQKKLSTAEQVIRQLRGSRVRYPQYVQAALDAIRASCPQAEPRVLCDYVEVLDEQWQMAVEGLLGGTRFAVIVDREFESEAIRIVRGLPGKNRTRVIQGAQAARDSERIDLSHDSILHLMRFSDKTAEHYLRASYGSVVQVTDTAVLKSTRRGVTAEGIASGNYALFRCDMPDSDLVFGEGARARALAAQESQFEQLLAAANELNDRYNLVRRVSRALASVKPLQLQAVVARMLGAQQAWRDAEQSLANLDLSGSESLEAQAESLRIELEQARTALADTQKVSGRLERDCEQHDKQGKALAAQQDLLDERLEQEEHAVQQITTISPDFDPDVALEQADREVELAGEAFDFEADLGERTARLEELDRKLYRKVPEHNQLSAESDNLIYEPAPGAGQGDATFRAVSSLERQVEALRNRLKHNLLAERHEQLGGLKQSFNTTFVTHLCHAIYQSVNRGKEVLDQLNLELEHHRFGADRERFRFAYRFVPEFEEYYSFFKALIDLPNLGEGESLFDAELKPKHRKVRDKLLGMLLDADEQTALRELQRVSDYRNYREYEIYKEPEGKDPIALSQYGTGSGGQLETPAYIIRSAAVTSAFRFNEGSSHLRMVLVDEAFSKMDETRSREVINYLTETLGLQLLFIMPTSKCGPFMDLVSNQFVFSKCPSPKPVGELNTRVYVDRKVCNSERIAEMMANHRRTIRHQAMLDFMAEVESAEA
ncbi:ATP-binding protein [Biformimicrobium ophioploci]|uniref:SbcC/MukB-like Walker B domain-containing protein n=1 Tax=Biformimicrobium ophioploci TaxID=3036711 RepID=A0ABQ6M312_9GAMM|nr:SbcC/MukB-like Walker B domain-containing protein [Microbulbifer sp. NKW57]GMG88718.1 SbcC/MukB-like Walker B domain-containing protein [Microbulbifer sp. NKW57]